MSPEPLDGSVIVYDTDRNQYEPSNFTVDDLPGGSGGSSNLNLANGGTVALDDSVAEGSLVGFRVKATTTFTSAAGETSLPPGAYTFERTDTGWRIYAASEGVVLGETPVDPPAEGWELWDSIDFASATPGTFVSPKDFPTDEGRTLRVTSDTGIVVGNNKIKGEYQQGEVTLTPLVAAPEVPMRVTAQIELVGTNASYSPKVSLRFKMFVGSANVIFELDWQNNTGMRMILSPDYGSGHVITAGGGRTVVGSTIQNVPTSGVLVATVEDSVLTITINDELIGALDCTNSTYSDSPNPLVGSFVDAGVRNDGALYNLSLETVA